MNDLLRHKGNGISRILKDNSGYEERVDALFWNILTRAPSTDERTKLSQMLRDSKDKRATMEDLAWSLLNAKEFVLRR